MRLDYRAIAVERESNRVAVRRDTVRLFPFHEHGAVSPASWPVLDAPAPGRERQSQPTRFPRLPRPPWNFGDGDPVVIVTQ